MPNLVRHRSQASNGILRAYKASPAQARVVLAEHILPLATEQLIAGLKRSEPRMVELAFNLAGMMPNNDRLIAALLLALGVKDEGEAKRRVEITQEADSMTDADRLEVACGVVVDLSRSAPELIRRSPQALEAAEAIKLAMEAQ